MEVYSIVILLIELTYAHQSEPTVFDGLLLPSFFHSSLLILAWLLPLLTERERVIVVVFVFLS